MRIRHSHVLVTGASRGLGRAIAGEIAGRDPRALTLVARSADALDAAASSLGATAVRADLSDLAEVEQVVPRAVAANGPVDILVNNAGLNSSVLLAAMAPAPLAAQLTTNLLAPLELARAALPSMVKRGSGTIVNIGSISGDVAIPQHVPYCASKAGLTQGTLALQRELRGTGVNVLLALLGLIRTDMIEEVSQDPVAAAIVGRFAALRALNADDVARRVAVAIEADRATLVLPAAALPMHHVRMLPVRAVDIALRGVLAAR